MRLPLVLAALSAAAAAQTQPNVVVLLADDLGHGDVGPYDHDNRAATPDVTNTPNLDQLASEGVTMTHFYANSPVCSPSRAALLTGRNAIRPGITWVYTPGATGGLDPDEVTIAEVLEPLGYRTGIVGKWHLGEAFQYLPLQQGFDEFFGVPYSNNAVPLYLLEGNTVTAPLVPQETLTQSFTTQAKQFIDDAVAAGEPFFLYVAYTAPHVPLFVSEGFEDVTGRGVYADVVFEMDWSIGELLDHLDLHGVADDTLVMFMSDNGACNNGVIAPQPGSPGEGDPWRWACGSNEPFSGFKFGFLEGGLRVPFIARWPAVIPAGITRDTLGGVIDVLPTIASAVGTTPPLDRVIDGEDLLGVWTDDAPRRLDELHFYALFQGAQWGTRELTASRRGKWKQFYDAHFDPGSLFDLESDPGETTQLPIPSVANELWDRSRDFDCRLDEGVPYVRTENLASWVPTTASSSVGCSTSSRAVDGVASTTWTTGPAPGQDLTLDLGTRRSIQRVILQWGDTHATDYAISTSDDGVAFTQRHLRSGGNGGRDVVMLPTEARYLRLDWLASSGVGYDLREVHVQAPKLPDEFNNPIK